MTALFFLLMADKHVDNFIEKIQGINLIVYEWYETDKAKLGDVIEDLLIDAYLDGALAAEDYLDFKPNTDIDTTRMFETINKDIAGKTFRQRVDEYVEQDNSLDEIVRVAETEFHRVYNEGAYDRAVDCEAKTKTWHCMNLPTSRDSHIYLDGMTKQMDEAFYSYNGHSAMFPHGFSEPSEDINCLCWLTFDK